MKKKPKHPPAEIGDDHWRHRWWVLPGWNRLHRVSVMESRDYPDWPDGPGKGVTVCGRRGDLCMPGIFSRMGAERCAHCCDLLGIPRGNGAPFNDETLPPEVQSA